MNALKTILLAGTVSLVGTVLYLYLLLKRGHGPAALGLGAIRSVTIYDPLYWLGVVLIFVAAYFVVRRV
jgi:hypothetical protein